MSSHSSHRSSRRRGGPVAARIVGVLLMVWGALVAVATPASADVGLSVVPLFPPTVTVGQTGVPGTLSIINNSTGVEATGNVTVSNITLVPSCGVFVAAADCPPAAVDPDVFALSATGVGEAGTACAGQIFTITVIDSVQDKYAFTPTGPPVVLGPPGSPTDTCRINFTFDVLKAPTKDVQPGTPGLQTARLGAALGVSNVTGALGSGTGSGVSTVLLAQPAIVTQATPAVPVGTPITDTATLSGGQGPGGPTGTITFDLFGPNNPTCAGPPIFSSTVPVAGNGNYTSAPFTPTLVGSYQWVARYSGDANNNPATTACGDPGETTVVSPAQPQIVTVASPPVPIGGTITDTATLSGGFNPTGTITFELYGPPDPTCAGPPIFSSTVPVNGNGNYTSAPFTVTQGGTYRWVARYSGDARNAPATTACGDPLEQVTILANPTIVTQAQPTATVGQPITDTATLANGIAPTGTITFDLFGPNNPACAGAPIFSSTVPVNGNGNYTSAPFTTTQAGTYQWVARYSGDAQNNPAVSPCGAPNEQTVVQPVQPQIVTVAQPTAPVGSPITDTATLSGGVAPTGTITFDLFGPANPTCAGAPIFSSTVPVNGNGNYTSAPFTTTQAGTYQWVATYSGDANNLPATSPCGAPNEQTVVTQAQPQIVTVASPSVPVGGGTISDTATLSGGQTPTGTITFQLFGPNDATCAGPPAFTSTVPVNGNGNYTPATPFTPTQAGTYRWVASYSGDANNLPAGPTACNDPAEQVIVTPANPTIVTNASSPVGVGGQVRDTATLSGGVNPTGTITFQLFGPNDATCAGPPVFTDTVPVNGNGNYDSDFFTANQAGVYRWVASYSGDANNAPAGPTACNDPNEDVQVNPSQPALVTNASTATGLGGQVFDVATLSGGTNPTGTITFNLFGPNDATCTGPVAFTATVPVNGNGAYNSGPFTPTTAGTYRFIATYSGDANNAPAGPTACNDPAEQVVVSRVAPAITTVASADITQGATVFDTANLTGGTNPTGTITFNLYGPNDATCAGPPVFTSTVPVNGNGAYQSGNFTPTAPGVYRFTATYSGDVNNSPAGPTACNDPNEDVLVRAGPTIVTVASPSVPEGGSIRDTATLSGGVNPTGTITFLLFGPDDATCAGPTVATSVVPVSGNGAYQAPDFVTDVDGPNGPGTYRWVASYSGDANNAPAGPTACNDPNEQVVVTNQVPSIDIVKSVTPPAMLEPGGTFQFTVVVTNTSNETLTITSLTDDIYGNLDGRGSCTIGAVLAPNGGQYTCQFPGDFIGRAGDRQVDTATVIGRDDEGTEVTADDDAEVTLTPLPPAIAVQKDAAPPTRPEPGGAFTFSVVVTNTGPIALTITSLVDDVYGDLNGRGTCAIGAVLEPAGTYSCSFVGNFTGRGGDSQVDTVTVIGRDRNNREVTARDDAKVMLTPVAPTIRVTKTPDPTTRPAPGGPFTFTVTVTNTTFEPLTLTRLTDDIYGDLNNRGSCRTGGRIEPGATYTCAFTGEFRGAAGARQTDTVTAVAVNDRNQPATDSAQATVSLTPLPAAPPPPRVLARTGSDVGSPARLALALFGIGFLMVLVTTKLPSRPVTAASDGLTQTVGAIRDRRPQRPTRSPRSLSVRGPARPYVPLSLRRPLRRKPPLRWRGAQASQRRPSGGRRSPWGRGGLF